MRIKAVISIMVTLSIVKTKCISIHLRAKYLWNFITLTLTLIFILTLA